MTWKAQNNYVVVKVDRLDEYTTGRHGIVVPQRSEGYRVTGTVESVGPTCRIPELAPGMKVLFPPYGAGHRQTIGQDDYISLLDWEIVGYFKGDQIESEA